MKSFGKLKNALRLAGRIVGTVVLVLLVGGLVFANILAGYLQNKIMPAAQVNLDSYDLDKTSYLYYYDQPGELPADALRRVR